MAITYTYSGTLNVTVQGVNTFTGDQTGNQQAAFSVGPITFGTSGGSAPTLTGFVQGSVNATTGAQNIMLAHATNILTNLGGTATYSDGFTVAGNKVKVLAITNNDATNNITIASATANSFAIVAATNQSLAPLQPGSTFLFYFKNGFPTGGLTTGTNDALAITAAAGTPNLTIQVMYGN